MKQAIERLRREFEKFADSLRDIADDVPDDREDRGAGFGEEPDEYIEKANPAQAQARNGLDDNSVITMKSGDLRKVIDAYRKYVRYARQGKIPNQDERVTLHQAVRAVKHLIRKPVHGQR